MSLINSANLTHSSSLFDLVQGEDIWVGGINRGNKLYTLGKSNESAGSKVRSFGEYGTSDLFGNDQTSNNGPLLGDRVTFSADNNADPTFEYGGEGYTRGPVIDNVVRGGTKFNLQRRETDFNRMSKFIYETAQGQQFIAKETALQLLTPFKPKVYNLGLNTLAQITAAGASNIKRGGLIPFGEDLFPNQGNYFGKFKKEKKDIHQKYGLGSFAEKTDPLDALIGISLDDIGEFFNGPKGYNVPLKDSSHKIDRLNMVDIVSNTKTDFGIYETIKDFIPFKFEVIDHSNPFNSETIYFRAFLDSLSDDYSANFNEVKYNGRPEPFYTYNSFGRKIGLSFKIAAQTRHEMIPLYRKVNYLVSQTAPGYAGDRMTTPYMRLTVGDWVKGVPGVLNSVGLAWKTDYPWEIKADDDMDSDMLILPHILDITVSFTPTHDFMPTNLIDQSPFIGAKGDLPKLELPS